MCNFLQLLLGGAEIQSILQNSAIEQHYSLDCMPTKLVVPSTDKANRCLYEQLDPSNYESGARMVAFRTFHERIVPWIKILNLYYYELIKWTVFLDFQSL
jgi:hypothetical protein